MKLLFNKTYFIISMLLFIIEVLIATYLKTGFIRHTFGDYLVVILVYCFFRSFINTKPMYLAITTLIIAFSIEFLQLTTLLEWLQLNNNATAKIILGSTFHMSDLVAYTLGVATIYFIDKS